MSKSIKPHQLQRYCEENRPFFPLPDFKSSPFNRELNVNVWRENQFVLEKIYKEGHFASGFGSDFAIYKGRRGGAAGVAEAMAVALTGHDLIAVNRLVEDAKANVIELKPNEVLSRGSGMR